MKIEIPKMLRTITLLLILLLVLSVWTAWPSRGAVPKLDTIRVGIFLEVPSKYKLNTTTATFSSSSAMQIGLRQPSAVLPMGQTKAGETIRFTLDDYKPIVAETANFQAALSVVKRLKAIGGTGILSSVYRNSGLVYQVVEGSYPLLLKREQQQIDGGKTLLSLVQLDGQTGTHGPFTYGSRTLRIEGGGG